VVETWNPYPDVNLPELDSEHRALGSALRELLGAMVEDDRDRALELARALIARVESHFAHEDRLMRDVAYTNAERHAEIHQLFLDDARRQLEIVETRGLSADVLRWAGHLDHWFHRHVMTEDMWLAFAVRKFREAAAAKAAR
jgi:hemerythrin